MIQPTIGRVVLYHPPFTPDSGSKALEAQVKAQV